MNVAAGNSEFRMQYRGLRGWLDRVEKMGELRRVKGAHWDTEMGAITHMLTEKSRGTRAGDPVRRRSGLSEGLSHALWPTLLDPPHRADARPAART